MSSYDECKSLKYGDILQLTNWILDSGATCHMTPEVSDFIPGRQKFQILLQPLRRIEKIRKVYWPKIIEHLILT